MMKAGTITITQEQAANGPTMKTMMMIIKPMEEARETGKMKRTMMMMTMKGIMMKRIRMNMIMMRGADKVATRE